MKKSNKQMVGKLARITMGLLVCCLISFQANAESKKVYKLTFANQHPAEAPMNKVINQAWAKWLEKASKGRLEIVVYPAEQVAKAPNLYDAALNGLADITCQLLAFNPGRWPLTEVTQLPFLYDFPGSRAAAMTAMALFEKYPEIQAEHKGVKILGFHATGLNHIHTVKKPVYKMEDLKGLLLNTNGKIGVNTIKYLGGTPETIFPAEQYDAMAKGVITGNVLEWEGQFIWHMNELTHYSTQASIALFVFVHAMNLDTWNSLPPDLQALLDSENGKMFHAVHGFNFDKDDIMFKNLLDEQYKKAGYPGVYVLTDEERARWIKAVQPVHEEWMQDAAKKVDEAKARAILDDTKKFGKQFGGYPDEACPECADTLRKWGVVVH